MTSYDVTFVNVCN